MIYCIILVYILYRWMCPKKAGLVVNVYFGVPGSGKTTFAAHLAKEAAKESWVIKWARKHQDHVFAQKLLASRFFRRAQPVYSNVPITGTYKLEPQADIGKVMIVDGKVIIDEAGIEYNNRNFKAFPPDAIYWYKYHRHYECSVDIFSQSYEDMDITLRRLAQNYFVVKKSMIPRFIVVKKIRRKVGIDDNTHQIIDKYYFGIPFLDSKWIYSRPLWKLFNSFSRKQLPEKEWEVW